MNPPSRIDDLTARIDRLEQECRDQQRRGARWRRALLGLLVVAGATLTLGLGAAGDKVTADSVRLTGPDGKLRGLLSVTDDGNAALSLMDATGAPRTVLSVPTGGESKLSFLDAGGQVQMTLSIGKAGVPALVFKDGKGTTRVSLTTEPSGLILNNPDGQDRALIAVSGKSGAGVLSIKDAAGNKVK